MADKRWEHADIEDMHQLRECGWSLEEIGAAYGISRQRVHQLIGNTGWKTAQKYSPEFIAYLHHLRETGMLLREIGEVIGANRVTVGKLIGKTGRLPSLYEQTVAWYFEQGYTISSIAKILGVSYNRVYKLSKKVLKGVQDGI